MSDLNLLDAAARAIAAQVNGQLPMELHAGDLFAMLPSSRHRAGARRSPRRFALMLERNGVGATLSNGLYRLGVPERDSVGSHTEWASFHFWRLHQRLRQQQAPAEVFRSLSAHLWDLAWDAGGVTAARFLSYILLCWPRQAVEESLALRQPVYQPGEVPYYLRWIYRNVPEEERPDAIEDLMCHTDSFGRAFRDDHLRHNLVFALAAAPQGIWRALPARVNANRLEAQDLCAAMAGREIPLPSPLDWTDPPARSALQQLRELPGLGHVADQVAGIITHEQLQALRRARGMPAVKSTLHMAFVGNPGTGKTTVARLIGQALLEENILTGGQLVEVARADLVGEYLGQTAPRVVSALDRAGGGVLLIDEAHGLITDDRDLYGHEALDALVKGMEDRRDHLAVILCGYPEEMDWLLEANPGLRSRISRTIEFPDYSSAQLLEIFLAICDQHDYLLTPAARQVVAERLASCASQPDETTGNARMVRNLFEMAVQRQATRLRRVLASMTDEEINTLTADDLEEGTSLQIRGLSA